MIVHIPTSRQKLFTAKEINDLYDTSPLEDKMHQIMKKEKINAERQVYVKVNNQFYCLDFGILDTYLLKVVKFKMYVWFRKLNQISKKRKSRLTKTF